MADESNEDLRIAAMKAILKTIPALAESNDSSRLLIHANAFAVLHSKTPMSSASTK